MRKMRLLLVTLSLILGITGTCTFAEYLPLAGDGQQLKGVSQLAWWGGIYPEYCLPGAMKLVDAEGRECAKADNSGSESGEELPVKIRFKYLSFLNEW